MQSTASNSYFVNEFYSQSASTVNLPLCSLSRYILQDTDSSGNNRKEGKRRKKENRRVKIKRTIQECNEEIWEYIEEIAIYLRGRRGRREERQESNSQMWRDEGKSVLEEGGRQKYRVCKGIYISFMCWKSVKWWEKKW